MREIKFRYTAIRKNGHVFSAIFSIEQIEAGEAAHWFDVNYIGELTTVHREQFTGLRDKNGVEIYEGDIVRNITDVGEIECCGVVKCYETLDQWFWCGYGNISAALGIYNYKAEVIGNIHENPELLK